MTNALPIEKKKKIDNMASKRGYARWKGISKKDRSTEMSRVAKELWKKIRAGKLDTQA